MKNFSLFFILLSVAFCNSANAQENYNPNTYKYRFQKLRGFSTNYNLSGQGNNYNNNQKDTFFKNNDNFKNRNNNFALNFNCNYFKNINTEVLQHNSGFNVGLNIGSSSSTYKEEYKNPTNTYFQNNSNQSSGLGSNFNYYSNNRIYNPNNHFKLLNFSVGGSTNNNRSKEKINNTNSSIDIDGERKQSNYNIGANFEIGFGTGRLEYVTDPIMAAFMLKDLQEKAGLGVLTNEQVEAIGKGITTIRNTRFIDFRFRLIDQLEMLDSVLQANGVKSNKTSRYFTTINDNWLYATQFGRYTGKRWSYYLDNRTYAYNNINENNQKLNNTRHTKNSNFNRNLYNGIGIDYNQSVQKGIYRQNAWGINLGSGLQHYTYGGKNEDSIGTSGYKKTEYKSKPDEIISNIGIYYEYLWQPNTRTFFTTRLNPYINSNISRNGLRKSNPTKEFSNSNDFGLNTDFRYFKFFNARLSAFININFNIYNTRRVNLYEQSSAPSPIITSKNIGNNFNFNHNLSAGITYTLF